MKGGYGVVLRDHEGVLLAAAAGFSGGTSSTFEAELFAARQVVPVSSSRVTLAWYWLP